MGNVDIKTTDWIAKLAQEIGVLTVNNALASLEKEALTTQLELSQSIVNGLTERVLNLEANNKALRELIPQETIKKKVK